MQELALGLGRHGARFLHSSLESVRQTRHLRSIGIISPENAHVSKMAAQRLHLSKGGDDARVSEALFLRQTE